MENDSEFEHVKMKGHRNSVLALDGKDLCSGCFWTVTCF